MARYELTITTDNEWEESKRSFKNKDELIEHLMTMVDMCSRYYTALEVK